MLGTAALTARTIRPAGTRLKRTPARVDAILRSLRLGASRSAAAAGAGVSKDALRRWTESDRALARLVDVAERSAIASVRPAVRPRHEPAPGIGRPRKLTAELRRRLLAHVAAGMTRAAAAAAVDVAHSTLSMWIRRDVRLAHEIGYAEGLRDARAAAGAPHA